MNAFDWGVKSSCRLVHLVFYFALAGSGTMDGGDCRGYGPDPLTGGKRVHPAKQVQVGHWRTMAGRCGGVESVSA